MSERIFDVISENPQKQHIADQVEPAAVQKHAGQHSRPRRHHVQMGCQMRRAEQHRRDHAEAEQDLVLVLPELPQKGADTQPDQEIIDDRWASNRVVVIERDREDQAL